MTISNINIPDTEIAARAFLFYRRTGYVLTRNVFASHSKRIKKTNKSAKKIDTHTLGDLLDSLNECHDQLTMPTIKSIDWLDNDKRRAFRKIGTYVIQDKLIRWESNVPASIPKPTIAVVHWMRESEMRDSNDKRVKEGKEKLFSNSMLFAIKIKTLPAYVSKAEGEHFEFGVGLLCNRSPTDGDTLNRLVWRGGYVTVTSAGKVILHDELRATQSTINVRNPFSRKAIGPKRHVSRLQWSPSSLLLDEQVIAEGGIAEAREGLACAFSFLLFAWDQRNKAWLVSTERQFDESRVTFIVSPNSATTFFKDRNKTAKARDGKAKRIIHICESHTRDVSGKEVHVKSHIRGIREFEWKNFKCKVTAPQFHLNKLISGSMNIPSEDLESMETPGEYLTAEGLAEKIAEHDYDLVKA